MYKKCPVCKGKGIFKKETCPVCLGERIIAKDTGLPPSKYIAPIVWLNIQPYYPLQPYYPITYQCPTTLLPGATASHSGVITTTDSGVITTTDITFAKTPFTYTAN